MAKETLEQWATRMTAGRLSAPQPRDQLNRRSLTEAAQSRGSLQAATDAHQQRMAQREAAQAQATSLPSLGGSFLSRVASLVIARTPESVATAPNRTSARRDGPRPS